MKSTIKKAFLDLSKEEEWLNTQGENGLLLTNYSNGTYEFEDVSPTKFYYKIDIPKYSGSKKKDYLNFLELSGISVVSEYGGRIYLRKNQSDGPFDLYTENKELNEQMKKRYSYFIGIGISHFILGIVFLISMLNYANEKSAAFWITCIFGIIFLISGSIFILFGIFKQKKHTTKKEKFDVWE